MLEKISSAAIKCSNNRIFTGRTHLECWMKIADLRVNKNVRAKLMLDNEDGFMTDTGRFVGREEAFHIAKSQQQILPPDKTSGMDLSNELVNRDFYQQDHPRLDSGMIESYAPLKAGALVSKLLE